MRAYTQETLMTRVNIVPLAAGITVSFLISSSIGVAHMHSITRPTQDATSIYGLHVALPSNMKNFPVELVPLP
jgi:hypothetical protein